MTGGTPWRDSGRPVRLYGIDARLLLLFAAWIVVPGWTTTAAVVLALAAFRWIERRGYRPESALRALRARLAGRRGALSPWRVPRAVDYG